MNLSHLTEKNTPQMVDVAAKEPSSRLARAEALVEISEEIAHLLETSGKEDIYTAKGAVFQTAILAGIMAAKKTQDIIPLCHSLPLENCTIDIHLATPRHIVISCQARTTAKTGVEMEALTGASIAALTVYDMCKALSHDIVIREIKLMEKRGGKNDFQREK